MSQAKQPPCCYNRTVVMGLLPQGPPDHSHKQRHGHYLRGNGVANQEALAEVYIGCMKKIGQKRKSWQLFLTGSPNFS